MSRHDATGPIALAATLVCLVLMCAMGLFLLLAWFA